MSDPIADDPAVLPSGYRLRWQFFWRPIRVGGRLCWCRHVPIVQRLVPYEDGSWGAGNWFDVGLWEEVRDHLRKPEPMPE